MTTSPRIETCLTLSAVSAVSSARCVQWTDDGQLLLLTKSVIYILTPGLGFTSVSGLKTAADKDANVTSIFRSISWSKTVIVFDRSLVHNWPADSQEWGAVSLGSLDLVLRAVTSSPSNAGGHTGCVLAVLNSNSELTLWGPAKNYLTGEWVKLLDITAELRKTFSKEDTSTFVKTLQAQSTSVEWSKQLNIGDAPARHIDGSLLAVGSRAGCITFIRFWGTKGGTWECHCVAKVFLSDRWVVHVAWSSWTRSGHNQCEAYLACGVSDGSVMLIKIVQKIKSHTVSFVVDTQHDEFERSCDVQSVKPCETDSRSINGIRWFDTSLGHAILIVSKPGSLYIWSSPDGAWSGLRIINIRSKKLSVGSSALCSMSGVAYIAKEDTLVVSLTDGSFHVIYAISTDPSAEPPTTPVHVLAGGLSVAARAAFAEVEPGQITWKDVNRTFGMTLFDEDATFVWAHEASQPTDFSYKHDARHTTTLVVSTLCKTDPYAEVLRVVKSLIHHPEKCVGESSQSQLRPALFHLRDPALVARIYQDLLDLLQQDILPDDETYVPVPSTTSTEESRQTFRISLHSSLFCLNDILSQRMRLFIVNFCQQAANEEKIRRAFAVTMANFLAKVWQYDIRAIIRHLQSVIGLLTSAEVPYLLRVAALAKLPGMSAALAHEADALLVKMKVTKSALDVSSFGDGTSELCPACHAQVPLNDLFTATCENGHIWSRCSMTSFLLTTPAVRTCVGCGCKALMADAVTSNHDWLPAAIHNSWVVADLLDVATRCFFCGSNFVALL